MTTADLKTYRAVERKPLMGRYHGYDILSMPPPSSGGTHLIEILNILEGYDLRKKGPASPPTATEKNRNGSQCDSTAKPASAGEWNFWNTTQ